ncbi:MAG: type II secretion system F family protein [Actinomycetia bacterium]|nr:type II secretion system F family protein [Actinomycetes bacterium]
MSRATKHQDPLEDDSLADALDLVVSALRAGLPPAAALVLARESSSWGRAEAARLERVIGALETGARTRSAWLEVGDPAGATLAYRAVGVVWDAAIRSGAPLAEALAQIVSHLREEARLAGRVEVLASGPRTSQRVLCLLPLLGPVLALLIGIDPRLLYLSSPLAAVSAVIGLLLTLVGTRWSRRMIEQAVRPPTYAALAADP